MALPSLTLRNTKGSPLTFAEMDTNLQNLQQADFNVSVGANTSPIRFDSTLTFANGSGVSITLNTSTRTLTFASGATFTIGGGSTSGTITSGDSLSFSSNAGLTTAYNSGTRIVTYSLNTATASIIGGVKIGSGVSISGDGTISVSTASAGISTGKAIAMTIVFA